MTETSAFFRLSESSERRQAIAESLAMLAEDCAALFAEAFSLIKVKRDKRECDDPVEFSPILFLQRLQAVQRWIDLHMHALETPAAAAELMSARYDLRRDNEDISSTSNIFDHEVKYVSVGLARLEGRVQRIDELLYS